MRISGSGYLLLSLILGFLPTAMKADPSPHPSAPPKHEWNWLSEADKARLLKSIPPAPKTGSALDKSDLQGVLQAQATRTAQDISEARDDEQFRLESLTRVLDLDLTEQKYPKTLALLEHVRQNESLLNSTLKKKYARLRPYQAHPEVKELFQVEQYSYPSGHASGSRTWAEILAELFPHKKGALLDRADQVARSRVEAGVHYPSDIEQGKKLGDALVHALLANAAFQRDLAEAKVEIAAQKS